jgi:hypothetical protein
MSLLDNPSPPPLFGPVLVEEGVCVKVEVEVMSTVVCEFEVELVTGSTK